MGLPRSCKVELKNKYEKGKRNLITDVPGVKVGHVTLHPYWCYGSLSA